VHSEPVPTDLYISTDIEADGPIPGPHSTPFRHSGHLGMKSMFATKARVPVRTIGKRSMPKHLLSTRPHTHNALDDVIEQGEMFSNLFEWSLVATA
jgi:hypothetical protein